MSIPKILSGIALFLFFSCDGRETNDDAVDNLNMVVASPFSQKLVTLSESWIGTNGAMAYKIVKD